MFYSTVAIHKKSNFSRSRAWNEILSLSHGLPDGAYFLVLAINGSTMVHLFYSLVNATLTYHLLREIWVCMTVGEIINKL